jgi:hypothetical protein
VERLRSFPQASIALPLACRTARDLRPSALPSWLRRRTKASGHRLDGISASMRMPRHPPSQTPIANEGSRRRRNRMAMLDGAGTARTSTTARDPARPNLP